MDQKQVKPFGLSDKIGYLFGDFGNDFTFIFASTFLMVFYMKVLGIPGAAVGTLFLIARVVDAFTDVTMGRIVDICKPGKDGRFKQWIRRMAGPVAIASFLMYQSSLAGASMTVKIVYMYVTYLLWGSICYTGINIPYGSMASAITEKPEERTALSTFRGVGANLAQLVIGVLGPVIIYTTDVDGAQVIRGGGSIFPVVAGIFSVCAILCYVICYKCTTERVRIEKDPDAPKVTLLQTFATIFSSRAMLGIIGAALFLMLSQLLISGLNMYLYADYFGDVKAFSSYTFINIMLSLVLAGFVGRITGRMGKKEAAAVATAFTGAVYLVLFALKLTNPWIYMISSAIGFLGVNFFNLVIWANITDVIDDAEVRNGKREDGTIYAVYSFARKVGQALAGGLSGYAMGLIGYESAAKVQTAEVLNGLYTISTLVPALLFFCVTFMLLVVYPLNKKKVEENSEILQKRRAAR
ncbi:MULTISPECIES: glycoside-pentoside-hexuronide (GPH):cation symporter [Enterocloster]|uniref:MFS transporter n=1 Tax=Enterocloster TaxID=2719313 RepID=UPI000D1AA20C|nr:MULTISPECIES: glycoside-pentoside-hexuronide (GPH):cation symporter [Enterocloster]MDR3757241.1 glycoside-pentoside-hexuronide (GPH):cation symporter [Enterocloster sp.]PST34637.1 MFS transporter [Enterocloster lavalensis]